MSKKKKKLDKKLIQERLRELEAGTKESTEKKETPSRQTQEKVSNHSPETTQTKINESDLLIIKDMKKVAVLAVIILLIFMILFFVNLKTDYIIHASDKIMAIFHIGQL
jgi:hypothetical protein